MIVILGAGISGLHLGYCLKREFVVLEKEKFVGGLGRTIEKDGYLFDVAGHLLHYRKDKYVKNLIEDILPGVFVAHKKKAFVSLNDKIYEYPIQKSLDAANLSTSNGITREHSREREETDIFKYWLEERFGRSLCELFFWPYNEKCFRYPLEKILTGNSERRMNPSPGQRSTANYNREFHYPANSGIGILPDTFHTIVRKKVCLNQEAVRIDRKKKTVELRDGSTIKYNILISTIPLLQLIRILDDLPQEISDCSKKLRWCSLSVYNMGIRKSNRFRDAHWIYFPEKEYSFHRVGFYSHFNGVMAPPDHDSIYVEIAYRPGSENSIPSNQAVIHDLIGARIIKSEEDIIHIEPIRVDPGYCIRNLDYDTTVSILRNWLADNNIRLLGRFSEWSWSSMHENIVAGRDLARNLEATN